VEPDFGFGVRANHPLDPGNTAGVTLLFFGKVIGDMTVLGLGDKMKRRIDRNKSTHTSVYDGGIDRKRSLFLPPIVVDIDAAVDRSEMNVPETIMAEDSAILEMRLHIRTAQTLDQNFAITFAEKSESDSRYRDAREAVLEAVGSGKALFPYSELHLIESAGMGATSRNQLAEFWDTVSCGYRFIQQKRIRSEQFKDLLLRKQIVSLIELWNLPPEFEVN